MTQKTPTDYKARWKNVETLINEKGLTQSAITEIRQIHTLAKKENQPAQALKALVYLSGELDIVTEDADAEIIDLINTELASSGTPQKQLLHSLLATKYQQIFEEHRWELYDRTPTSTFNEKDPATWSLQDFHRVIAEHYLASLQAPDELKKISLKDYEPIIVKGNASHLRPTLYDLIAHRALCYFENDERDLPDPVNVFEVNDEQVFADAAIFSKAKIATTDSNSLYYRAITIYQELISFHLDDKDPSALLALDLSRLEFMQEVSVIPDKTTRYTQAMESIAKKYPDHPSGALAAVHVLNQKKKNDEGLNRFHLVDLEKSYLAIMDKFPGTHAAAQAYQEWREITDSTLNLQTELVNIPGKPFLALVSFKNIKGFHYRIIPLDMEDPTVHRTENYWKEMTAKTAMKQLQVTLPDPGDHREHRVEIGIDELPVGRYAILSSISPDFATANNILSIQYFHISGISYLNRGDQYFIVDRETGKPLSGAWVEIVQQRYDQASRKPALFPVNNTIANSDGYAKIRMPQNFNGALMVDVRWNDDRLFTNQQEYRYSNREEQALATTGVLFTDRAIYRPGQTIFFKGILINKDPKGKNNAVIPDRKADVLLHDANGEIVDSLSLTSNAFGSLNGKFKIPEGRLTGSYSLTIKGTSISKYFQVEEYKRPGFEVSFQPIKTEFRLNDEIIVQGSVAGYAGNMLNDAGISYRVVRNVRLPWWMRIERFSRITVAEIANGKMKTDENGKFEIRFKALPDPSFTKTSSPTFDYTVYVDATDNSGETRSGEKMVSIAYKAMDIKMKVSADRVYSDTLSAIPVSIKNLAGEPLTSSMLLEIAKLETPKRLIRKRYWATPDTSVMGYGEFIKKFPHDEYMDETDRSKWKQMPIATENYQAVQDGGTLRFKTLKAGVYKFVVRGKDKYGEEVRDDEIITVLDTKVWTQNTHSYTINPNTTVNAEPGTNVRLQLGSSADSVSMIRMIENGKGILGPVMISNNAGMISMNIKTTENDRGGITINHAFVKHNRFFNIDQFIDIPWGNKALEVSTETYRDKLLPGAKETWKVKIRGAKADKVAAELLTSMYDASLDQFVPHGWLMPDLFRRAGRLGWTGIYNFRDGDPEENDNIYRLYPKITSEVQYDELIWNPYKILSFQSPRDIDRVMAMSAPPAMESDAMASVRMGTIAQKGNKDEGLLREADTTVAIKEEAASQPRRNFTETAFFIPDLKTDKDGNVEFSFTMPESLTKWKWMSFAHTKDLATGMMVKEIVTQKELMVQPNMPRFLREGDKIILSARISNLADRSVSGEAALELVDPETNTPVDGLFKNAFPKQYFTAEAKQTTAVQFEVEVPSQYTKPLQFRIIAKAGNNSDGEENVIPVLSNRIMVTESLPLQMLGNGTREFNFTSLLNNNSNTITHYRITTEYSTNPAWYAVLSLPYVMEYPYECAEQTFSRLYANALAAQVAGSSPAIKSMFEKWRTTDTAALISNLLKNQELKQVLIEQTPWVLDAKTESQQRRNIAMLFEAERLTSELYKNIAKLSEMQGDDGAFPWFKGGPSDRYITQYIVTGIGRLERLNAIPVNVREKLEGIRVRALEYLDTRIAEDLKELKRRKAELDKKQISPLQSQYLYMRSFFKDEIDEEHKPSFDYYLGQASTYWLGMDRQSQAMVALALHRYGNKTAEAIMKSLKENAIVNPQLGMYWKENTRGYYWYQAPVETQSLLIEAFDEVAKDNASVEQMKLWLLNQKRVQGWESTKATADAVYALVSKGGNWLSGTPSAVIRLGDNEIRPAVQEAGTGYFNHLIEGNKVKNEMGRISVNITGTGQSGLSWGAVHWQYFEDMNKVTSAATPLSLSKQFFVERMTNSGPVLEELKEGDQIKVGNKLKVRVVLKADRDMEYIHMRDMRAAGTEPVNVLSGYRWQGGLGYYESTRDASTDFFFSWIPKGTWVFEYPLFVTHSGQFSAGICTIQSMYAPEFNAHSEGRKISAGPRE